MRTRAKAWVMFGLAVCGGWLSGRAEDMAANSKSIPAPAVDGRGLVEQLRGRGREIDPFGCAMNPSTKMAIVVEAPPAAKEEEVRTSLQIALQSLMIHGVNPAARTILLGPRRLKEGDSFCFQHGDANLRLLISRVSLRGVAFTDLDTGEKALREIEIAPSFRRMSGAGVRLPVQPIQGPLTVR